MNIDDIIEISSIIGSTVVVANAITATTPTKTGNKYIDLFLYVLNILSINVGKNKNADDI